MITKRIIGLALLLWIVMPAPARSDDVPEGRWWRVPRIADRLHLNEDQKRRLDDKFYANRRHLIDLKGALEDEQLDLRRLMEKDPMDEAAVMNQFKNLDAARSRLATERFRFVLEVRKTLGYERFQRLEYLMKQYRHRMPRSNLEPYSGERVPHSAGGNSTGTDKSERWKRWLRW